MYNLPCNHVLIPKLIQKYMNFIINYKYNILIRYVNTVACQH